MIPCTGRPGREHLRDAELLQLGDVVVGDRPADNQHHVLRALAPEQLGDPRHERHVRARQDREPDRVGVLLKHGLDDLLGRLVQTGVDHLHAGVAQRAGDDLRPAVVPVETRLRHDDSDLAAVHAAEITPSGGGAAAKPKAPSASVIETQQGEPAGVEAGRGKRRPGGVAGGPAVGALWRPTRRRWSSPDSSPAVTRAAAGARRADGDGPAHVRVGRAEVGERAGLVERLRAALARVEDAGVEAAVVRGGGMRRRAVVGPGDGVARVDRDGGRRELEVADGHPRVGGRRGPRSAAGAARLGLAGGRVLRCRRGARRLWGGRIKWGRLGWGRPAGAAAPGGGASGGVAPG